MVQVIKGSHYWDSIETLISFLEICKSFSAETRHWRLDGQSLEDHIITGLKNSLKEGYDIKKIGRRKKQK